MFPQAWPGNGEEEFFFLSSFLLSAYYNQGMPQNPNYPNYAAYKTPSPAPGAEGVGSNQSLLTACLLTILMQKWPFWAECC